MAALLWTARRHGSPVALAKSVYRQVKAARLATVYAAQVTQYRAESPLAIYGDAPGEGWQDWSWATHSLTAAQRVYRGKYALSMVPEGWKGVYLHHDLVGTAGYGVLQAYVHGDAGINVCIVDESRKFGKQVPLRKYVQAGGAGAPGWKLARIPLADLGLPRTGANITGVVFQAAGADRQPELLLDEIALLPDPALPVPPAEITVAVTVDPAADRHPISPYIYGMAWAPKGYVSDLRLAVNRWGGNHVTRYNWVHGNACNAARDWRWANRVVTPDLTATGSSSFADHFVRESRAAGATALLTVPTIGWVAGNTDNNTTSLNVPAHGGPPVAGADGAIAGYDPSENRRRTSVRSLPRKGRPFMAHPDPADRTVYQDEWVHHLVSTFGAADKGGVRFYAMDNEPDLWDHTHTDVHPAQTGYDDILANFLDYGTAVKAVDPAALITGPVAWGWTGYLYSPLDRGSDNFRTHADRKRHGGEAFLPWFLKQVKNHDLKTGKRTLDVLDVHYYPQAQGIFGSRTDPAGQELRVRSTRALWDPGYVDESWIGEPVRLIPRLKEWINAGYPGTKIGITEWNFGADNHMSGALAIAEALGIYGREGVYLANYWAYPPEGSPGYLAFKMYRNADGKGTGFGSESCRAVSAEPNQLSSFAATDPATGTVTVMLVNKMRRTAATVPLKLGGRPGAEWSVRSWRVSGEKPQLAPVPDAPVAASASLTLRCPAYSITLVHLTAQEAPAK